MKFAEWISDKRYIGAYETKRAELNSEKLCPFSGSAPNPDTPTRACSRTGNPKKLGDCGSCRVASEWEECYD